MPRKDIEARRVYQRAYMREYLTDPKKREAHNAIQRRYRANNPDVARDSYLRRNHGISLVEWDLKLEAQGGCCAACQAPGPGKGGWHTDHDHRCCPGSASCGKCIRGILCHGCNTTAGLAGDDPARLRALADYLEAYCQEPAESAA